MFKASTQQLPFRMPSFALVHAIGGPDLQAWTPMVRFDACFVCRSGQLICGLLICVLSILVSAQISPFIDPSDNKLYLLSQAASSPANEIVVCADHSVAASV